MHVAMVLDRMFKIGLWPSVSEGLSSWEVSDCTCFTIFLTFAIRMWCLCMLIFNVFYEKVSNDLFVLDLRSFPPSEFVVSRGESLWG
jgi:hypothetical protein